jgi:hypothetical protein
MKAYKWIALILPAALSGCIIANVESGRAYNGIDSEYTSSMNTEITAACIKNAWQNSDVHMGVTESGVNQRNTGKMITLYTVNYLEIADVLPLADDKSKVIFYHNGDKIWGTKKTLISAIKGCL